MKVLHRMLAKRGFAVIATPLVAGLLLNTTALAEIGLIETDRVEVAQASNQSSDLDAVDLTYIYVSDTGELLGFLVYLPEAVIGIDSQGTTVKILERSAGSSNTVEYYLNGLEMGKIKSVGAFPFVYHTTSPITRGKIKQIGNLSFSYYESAYGVIGNVQAIGTLSFSYHATGLIKQGKIRQIGNVSFEYDQGGWLKAANGEPTDVVIKITPTETWTQIFGVSEQITDYQALPYLW